MVIKSSEADFEFVQEIRKLGGASLTKCFQCGTCTAICPIASESRKFPRRFIRDVQLGLADRVIRSLDPWLCFYCGDCTETCPRDADPGAVMMAARRYAIRKYSWGRISDAMYSSKAAFYGTLAVLSLLLAAIIMMFHGPVDLSSVDMFTFIPMDTVDRTGILIGVFVGLSALANLLIMNRYVSQHTNHLSSSKGIKSLPSKFEALFKVIVNEVALQKRFHNCLDRNRYWAHLLMVWGFFGLLAATTLDYMIDSYSLALPHYVPRGLGIASGLALVYGSVYFVYKHFERKEEYATYTHFTDWAFLILLLLTGASGFLLDLFLVADMPLAAYVIYAVHLVIVFDLLVTAPFTKFVHALYRPFALLIEEMSQTAKKYEISQEAIQIAA